MSLSINSPSYYTAIHGIDDEIYRFCRLIEKSIDIRKYTSKIDNIGIIPIIAPKNELNSGKWQETKKVSLAYRLAIISLTIDYSQYIGSDINGKKVLIADNVCRSLLVISKRLKNDFLYEEIKNDFLTLLKISSVKDIH